MKVIANWFPKLAVALTMAVTLATSAAADDFYPNGGTAQVRTVRLDPINVSIELGATRSFRLPFPGVLHRVFVQAEARGWGDAAAEVWVNGEKKGDLYVPRTDPNYTVTIGGVPTDSVQIIAVPVAGTQGTLVIRAITAVFSEISAPPGASRPCLECGRLPFPSTYTTVIGNVSNRAIFLVDQLESYTSYRQYGDYLLPIKKAAVLSLARAEAYGDASVHTRPSALHLLETLDWAEPYLDDMFERDRAFELARHLLGLREYVRRVLY